MSTGRFPNGQAWHNLRSIDFRIRGGKTALWARWDEANNLISLCRKGKKDGRDDEDDEGDNDAHGPDVHCTPGGMPGSRGNLQADRAQIVLAESAVIGSGPTGHDVTLVLAIVFLDKAAGHSFNVELAAADDFGAVDRFVRATDVRVE